MMKMFTLGLYCGLFLTMATYFLCYYHWILAMGPMIFVFLYGAMADDHYNEMRGWRISSEGGT